ncbi:MAG: hypothetical protein IJ716_09710 [Lachnospiraceae bacterium]|nr:hypothetical protein [Lachnospiraceae bacterium]
MNDTSEEMEQPSNFAENNQTEAEKRETIDNPADLEELKRTANRFNAIGNMGYTQIFVQNLSNLSMGSDQGFKKTVSESKVKVKEEYDLCNTEKCVQFVEKYKDSEYLTIAIILSTFEVVALSDLINLREILVRHIPKTKTLNSEQAVEENINSDSYIALNTILSLIGGRKFVIADGRIGVGFGSGSQKVLCNILEQFPTLKNPIVLWLMELNEIYQFHTTFDAYQMANALTRIISLDVLYAGTHIFPRLLSDPKNAGILGIIVYKLYMDSQSKEYAENIILCWVSSDSKWLWKAVCLTCAAFSNSKIVFPYVPDLKKAIRKRILYFKKEDLVFVSSLLRQSQELRSLFCNIFGDTLNNTRTRDGRLKIAQTYINFVRYSYYQVNSDFMELPLVVCDTLQQQKQLAKVVECTMSVYHLRKQLYAILKAYLKELSRYDYSDKTIDHISAYFYNMGGESQQYCQDILYFFRTYNNKATKQIFTRLRLTYEKRGAKLHE